VPAVVGAADASGDATIPQASADSVAGKEPREGSGLVAVADYPEIRVEYDAQGRGTDVEREELGGDPIQDPFDPAKIDVQTRTPTVNLLLSRLSRGVLDLDADFQRKAGLWTDEKQSRLIESLLLRIPLPTIYAAESDEETWTVVDGIQRLTTIARFVVPDALPTPVGEERKGRLRLTRLEYLTDYNGLTYKELPGGLQTRINETELVLHLIRSGTPEEVMFNIFARINTGGLPLTQQELRHALIKGRGRDLLRELAGNAAFLAATRESVNPDRMADREMIIRFLSFRRVADMAEYKYPDLDAFLRNGMKELNVLQPDDERVLIADFERSMHAAKEIFGDHAFRKVFANQKRILPINKAMFEAISVNLARLSQDELATLESRREQAFAGLVGLLEAEDGVFLGDVSYATGSASRVRRRFTAVEEMFRKVIA
jgi:hypothetical protein